MVKRLELRELFSPSAPVSEADLFAGRSRQLARLIDAVIEPGMHAVVYGEQGVGKTSLAITFHKLIGGRPARAWFPIRKPANPMDDYASLWRRVFSDFLVEVAEGDVRRASELYPEAITPDDVVLELSRQTRNRVPIIIFDEFDKLDNIDTKRLMSHTIKAISDAGVNAKILLVGVAEDIHVLVEEHQSVSRCISEIKMPRMSLPEMSEILNKRYPRLGMTISDDARWKILILSRGLPPYVHLLGREAAASAIDRRSLQISTDDVDAGISVMVQQSEESQNNAYRLATTSNRKATLKREVLLACAVCATDDVGYFAASDVVEPLSQILGRDVGIANFLSHLTTLSDPTGPHILERAGAPKSYRYRFRDPKMQPYVVMRAVASGQMPEGVWTILSAPARAELSSASGQPS